MQIAFHFYFFFCLTKYGSMLPLFLGLSGPWHLASEAPQILFGEVRALFNGT
jgi:hypothetical protein